MLLWQSLLQTMCLSLLWLPSCLGIIGKNCEQVNSLPPETQYGAFLQKLDVEGATSARSLLTSRAFSEMRESLGILLPLVFGSRTWDGGLLLQNLLHCLWLLVPQQTLPDHASTTTLNDPPDMGWLISIWTASACQLRITPCQKALNTRKKHRPRL